VSYRSSSIVRAKKHAPHGEMRDSSVEAKAGSKVVIIGECWAYNGKLDTYGGVYLPSEHGRNKRYPAHRYFYETLVGSIDDDLHLHHACEHPGCVNPAHLVPLTSSEHTQEHARLRRSA